MTVIHANKVYVLNGYVHCYFERGKVRTEKERVYSSPLSIEIRTYHTIGKMSLLQGHQKYTKLRSCYRGVPLQRCPHYRGVLTTMVSSLQRCPHYRGVLTTMVSSLQRCPHYRGVLTTEVSSLQRSSLQRCPHYRGVCYERFKVSS